MTPIRVLMLDLKSYYPSPAYQLGLLASYANQEEEVRRHVAYTFREHPREQPAEEIAAGILAADADLVTASNYAWNHQKICRILELLEASGRPLPRVLLGGPNSSGTFGDAMLRRFSSVSALVEGEGEPAFRDILCSLVDDPRRSPFETARNCVLRGEDGAVHRPDVGHRIQSLDDIPSPYLSGLLPVAPSPLFFETNRGCPYRCSFCYWGNGNAKIYRMSLDRVREELEFFARHKVSSFWIADANFGIFPTDAEIAEIFCEVNARHGYPFTHVGVNWAKNSSDRVLEIATTFRRGRMGCTTTLAVQSVTAEAEEKSRRYSMAPGEFAHLVAAAEERDLDTYTDVIWGLPGESLDEYLDGLDAVISTGVPAILIHQLYLLPGTEFFDERERLGLVMHSESGAAAPPEEERSDYAEYIVVSHPKMTRQDMIRGTRILGINHLLHNHDLGRIVDFYLARYGVTHRQVYEHLDRLLTGEAALDEGEPGGEVFLADVRRQILEFADHVGLDEFTFYRRLSDLVWYRKRRAGLGFESRWDEVRAFLRRFYRSLTRHLGVARGEAEQALLMEMVELNALSSPKPAWRPPTGLTAAWDTPAIWRDMQRVLHRSGRAREEAPERWSELAAQLRRDLAELLSDEYLAAHRRPTTLRITNPWKIPPQRNTADWLLSSRSKHCQVSAEEPPPPAAW